MREGVLPLTDTVHLLERIEYESAGELYVEQSPACTGYADQSEPFGMSQDCPDQWQFSPLVTTVTCRDCLIVAALKENHQRQWVEGKLEAKQSRFFRRKVYQISHRYDYATTHPGFAAGWFDPTPILGYLQLIAEDALGIDCSLTNKGAARQLVDLYGFKLLSGPYYDKPVDLYRAREDRCGLRKRLAIARRLLWRRRLPELLRECVEA